MSLTSADNPSFGTVRRIVHVVTGLQVGGAESALLQHVTQPWVGGYSHTVIALTSEGGMQVRFRNAGVELIVLDFRRRPLGSFVSLVRTMRALRPDIVQTWLYHADLFGGLAARVAGVSSVIWGIHTTRITGARVSTALVRRCCAWLSYRIPHTIVCVAESARREHVRMGYDKSRIVVVPNGIDLGRFVADRAERDVLRRGLGIGDQDVVVGTVGRFSLDKDHQTFVLAAARLASEDAHLRFLMVGPGLVAGNRALMRWIAETGHEKRFLLLGERTDVPACLAAMDIFCLSSRAEAFPLAVGEAMAMGLPCVSTDVGDVAHLLGSTGVIVPKGDPQALSQAVAGLVRLSPDRRNQLGQKARERILHEFSLERIRKRMEDIYAGVMQPRGGKCAD